MQTHASYMAPDLFQFHRHICHHVLLSYPKRAMTLNANEIKLENPVKAH